MEYVKKHIVWVLVIVAAASTYLFIVKADSTSTSTSSAEEIKGMISEEDEPEELPRENQVSQPVMIVVDVKGAVKGPGVYELSSDSRVKDAIDSAGGVLDGADVKQVNFAMKLQDEMVIYVPVEGEDALVPFPASATSETSKDQGGNQLNINTATEQELQTLSGIGPSKAAAIVSYREENGLFQSIEELTNVSGIGEKSLEKIKDQVTVK
ncbi:helix-hairpin-helix domain-containing protein [Metabacillus iocasae]|uniref:Competence protein ComEA n=1 Tax=Priestia iocasae TaxID=2291674 RepID=A0ABS2QPS4_9BACI|nr:helix-hairpin-helix domain-containing protein [Metabacillus iocasae]MBM7701455.1 competence protein ComEA [Metabacillus iocasae]